MHTKTSASAVQQSTDPSSVGENADEHPASFSRGEEQGDNLVIKESANGRGVFAVRNFRAGEIVIEFSGERLTRKQLLSTINIDDNHYLQIGRNLYLGPSGGTDDLLNHSCDPNAGVIIEKENVLLVALKTIRKDDEITFDYSTTMDDDWEEMQCNCASPRCRHHVRDFKYLPARVQKKYLRMGIVPDYIKKNYH